MSKASWLEVSSKKFLPLFASGFHSLLGDAPAQFPIPQYKPVYYNFDYSEIWNFRMKQNALHGCPSSSGMVNKKQR